MKNFAMLVLLMTASLVWGCTDPYIIDNGVHNAVTVTTKGVVGSSQMTSYNAPDNSLNLGEVTIVTGVMDSGALVSTKLLQGGTFSSVGSGFQIVGNGHNGVPEGAIFTGAFTGEVQWMLTNIPWNVYALKGQLKGKIAIPQEHGKDVIETITGLTMQCFTLENGVFVLVGGVTNLNVK